MKVMIEDAIGRRMAMGVLQTITPALVSAGTSTWSKPTELPRTEISWLFPLKLSCVHLHKRLITISNPRICSGAICGRNSLSISHSTLGISSSSFNPGPGVKNFPSLSKRSLVMPILTFLPKLSFSFRGYCVHIINSGTPYGNGLWRQKSNELSPGKQNRLIRRKAHPLFN